MEEIGFEQLKALLEGQTNIEIISEIKKSMKVRIEDKTYKVIGVTKTKLLEYFMIPTN